MSTKQESSCFACLVVYPEGQTGEVWENWTEGMQKRVNILCLFDILIAFLPSVSSNHI